MLADTHCHIDFDRFDQDRETVIKRAQECGVGLIVNVGSNLSGSRKSVELAQIHKIIFASVGIHPHFVREADSAAMKNIGELAKRKKVVAVGEIGLDYYVFDAPSGKEPETEEKKKQQLVLEQQIELAKKTRLPMIFHCRQAAQDLLGIIKNNLKNPASGVMHCFSQDLDFLKTCLDMGFYISFTANITYKKAFNLRELVKFVPLERLLLETDAPFLPAQVFRGKRNEPAYVKTLAEEVSRIKGADFEEISAVTWRNAVNLFRIDND